MMSSRRLRLRICSLIDRRRSSIDAVTVGRTYVSGMRCGTTRIVVCDLYLLGRRLTTRYVPTETTTKGTRIIHFRRHPMRMKSSTVYFLPGIMCVSVEYRQPQLQPHAERVPIEPRW